MQNLVSAERPRGRRRGPRVNALPSLAVRGQHRGGGNDWFAAFEHPLPAEADMFGTHPSRWYL